MSQATNNLTMDNVPGAPLPEDTPNNDRIHPPKHDLTCTPDPRKTMAYIQVVVVENVGVKVSGKAIGLYKKHQKYSE
jgi:hypothetical protein